MTDDLVKEVKYMASLARIALEPGEEVLLAGQLENILKTAGKLRELDTSGVEPTAHVVSRPVLFRDDQVRPSLPRELVLRSAPRREKGCFRVPGINGAVREAE